MEIPDIVQLYFPSFSEIPEAQVLSARQRLQTLMHAGFPDIDYRPNSPLGDLGLSPFAYLFAGAEIAMGRFMSDLDMANVSRNIIWNCFRKDTEFVTRQGVKQFADYKDGDVVSVLTHAGNWKKAVVRCHGQQSMVPITVGFSKTKHTFWATPDHRWILKDGSSTTALKEGQHLASAPDIFSSWEYDAAPPDERLWWAYGYVFGDGHVYCDAKKVERWSGVRLRKKDEKLLPRFLELGFGVSYPKSFRGEAMVYTGEYTKGAPDIEQEDWRLVQAFCSGYLEADGSRNYNATADAMRFCKIQATGQKHVEFIKKTFPAIGQYLLSTHDLSDQTTNLGKRGDHTEWFSVRNYFHSKSPPFKVLKVEHAAAATHAAWCLEVEDDHSFVLPCGLATGNCDYVRRFLGTLAVTEQATLQSSGVARFTFVEDKPYTLDRRAQYKFGVDVFRMRMACPGAFLILQVGDTPTAGTNSRTLVDIGGGLYCVDIPLVGAMTTAVSAGALATTDYPITELASVAALQDFDFGLPPSSLPVLAEKTRATFYSATPSSRGGAVRFLTKEFPELVGASAVTSGDREMMRDTINPLGILDGKLDLYAASPAAVADALSVELTYDPDLRVFSGQLFPSGIPYKLDSVVAVDAPSVNLTYGDDVKIYSRSKNAARAPLASCAYSALEELWVVVDMPFDTEAPNDALIPLRRLGETHQTGLFTFSLRQDPLLPPVIDATEAQGTMPFGVDILTRGFIPIVIDNFKVRYARRPGTVVLVEQARAEILAYVNKLASPKVYSDAKIGDAMFAAGASDMQGITIQAHVQWSVANAFLPAAAEVPADIGDAVEAQAITITDTKDLKVIFSDTHLGTPDACFEAIGLRNSILILDADNLQFSEV